MHEFSELLRPLVERLDLPQPSRSRVVLELAADLRDLHEHLLAEGLDEENARRHAIEAFTPSEEVVRELRRVHANPYRRFLDQLGQRAGSRVERGASVLLLLFVLLTTAPLMFGSEMFRHANGVAVPVAVLTLTALLLGAGKLYRLEIRQDHRPSRLRTGLGPLLGLAVANVLLGAGGAWVDLYRVSRHAAAQEDALLGLLLEWGIRSSAMVVLALAGAMVVAVLWFVLARRIANIERAEAALLLEL